MTTVYDMIASLETYSKREMKTGDPLRAVVYELRGIRTILTVISAQLAGIGEPKEES